ncbi:MAG: HK97 family phage prohead protease [Alphaproteobacteria bacterium]
MMTSLQSSGTGFFEGYASLFGIPDLSRDVVMPGAFRETLQSTGARGVRLLWQHDPAEPIGIWRVLREDSKGLYGLGQLNLDTQRGRELDALIKQGAVDGLSIGFRVKLFRRDLKGQGREILSLDLWEISLVSFPLLPQARLVKSGPKKREDGPNALN